VRTIVDRCGGVTPPPCPRRPERARGHARPRPVFSRAGCLTPSIVQLWGDSVNRGRTSRKATSAAKDDSVIGLVRAAAERDHSAWDAPVERWVAMLWAIALRHGLNETDAADVVQTTWLRLLEHIDDVRDPARIGSWLATTAQREALGCVARCSRLVPSGDDTAFRRAGRPATAGRRGNAPARAGRRGASDARYAAGDVAVIGRAADPRSAPHLRGDRCRRGAPHRQHRSQGSLRPADAGDCGRTLIRRSAEPELPADDAGSKVARPGVV
jgi:hypothetical protein